MLLGLEHKHMYCIFLIGYSAPTIFFNVNYIYFEVHDNRNYFLSVSSTKIVWNSIELYRVSYDN